MAKEQELEKLRSGKMGATEKQVQNLYSISLRYQLTSKWHVQGEIPRNSGKTKAERLLEDQSSYMIIEKTKVGVQVLSKQDFGKPTLVSSLQHYSQKPKCESNQNADQCVNIFFKCGIYTQWEYHSALKGNPIICNNTDEPEGHYVK